MQTVVVIPTYNEAENLPELAKQLLALEPEADVLVVDDSSPDGTGEIADAIAAQNPRFHVLHRTGPRGYSAASREGLRWALDQGFDAVASMDADLSHDPAVLPQLIRAVEEGADLAIGSRYCPGGELDVQWGPMRRAVSRSGSRYAHWALRANVKDCTSGFRCYRAEALDRSDFGRIDSDGYCFLIEILSAFAEQGANIQEVPITYVDRHAGASKISQKIILEALVRTTDLGLSQRLRRRRG